MTLVGQAILRTLSYFDCFAVPLTALEVWRNVVWMGDAPPPDFAVVETELLNLVSTGLIVLDPEGMYRLPRSAPATERLMREAAAIPKWRRVRRGVWMLSLVPFLEGVAVVNTMAIGAARADSDIDLLILSAPNRLFSVRLGAIIATSMLGLRRHGDKIANRLCLSFFLSEDALDLAPLTKQPEDPHLRAWAATAIVVFERNTIFHDFWRANQSWFSVLPHTTLRTAARMPRPPSSFLFVRTALEWIGRGPIGDLVEWLARALQMRLFRRHADSQQYIQSTDVVISSTVLKFHERDRRIAVREAWYDRMRQYDVFWNA